MISILIVFLLLIFGLLGVVAYLISNTLRKQSLEIDKMYYDEDGNHRYYERSLIEKLHYMRKHPDCGPLRSFRGLIFRKH